MDHDDYPAGTPLFDDDSDDTLTRPMAGPSEETSRLIGQHLTEREAQGREPYWPEWDD